ncbi:MAG: hybrid sensor histidine kinase/response regulator [Bacteroidota bacterium]
MENNEYKILVVDDNVKNIQVLASLLTDKNYDIEYALNGPDALQLVASENFDLILLDIMMPEMDGFEVCRRIKKDENKREIPIIFLTAKTDIESIQKAFKTGGVDYVNKPFNIDELLARVETHVELKVSKDKLKKVNCWLEEKVLERTVELKIANSKLLELDNAKTQFLKIISHEIRTPLNGIIGGLSLIKEYGLTEESIEFIDMLDISAKRLENFSFKALDISNLNAQGKEAVRLEKTNITEIISKVIIDLERTWKIKEINISQIINTDNVIINVDHKYFYKCMYNIIHNAIKFSPVSGLMIVSVNNFDNHLEIEIKDEGVGFNEGFAIDNIKPFDSQNHVDSNPGLGLFLSNQIIRAHSGTIENGNNKDKGAFVKILLPIN